MNVFDEFPLKDKAVEVKGGPMKGKLFQAEDWARNVMARGVEWPSDIGNPSVLMFWASRQELCERVQSDEVEFMRVCLSGVYGHVGWSGCIVMADELDTDGDES